MAQDSVGTIAVDGNPITITTTTPGQNASLTFNGVAGQRISMTARSGSTIGYGDADATILKPDGSKLAQISVYNFTDSFMDVQTLPVSGKYTIKIDPSYQIFGAFTTKLFNVVTDVSVPLAINGSTQTLTITSAGQNFRPTFSGSAGQKITIHIIGGSINPCLDLILLKPDRSQLSKTSSCSTKFDFTVASLPVAGTYTLVIDPSGAQVGSTVVGISSP